MDIDAIDLETLINAEQLEIVIGCLEEVHYVLVNGSELLVSDTQANIQLFSRSHK